MERNWIYMSKGEEGKKTKRDSNKSQLRRIEKESGKYKTMNEWKNKKDE